MGAPAPALCQRVKLGDLGSLPAGAYAVEPKLDGMRVRLTVADDGSIKAESRISTDISGKLVAVEAALLRFGDALAGTVLDGEAVLLHPDGTADFNATMRVMSCARDEARRRQFGDRPFVSVLLFDVLACQGTDVTDLPYTDRRALLEQLITLINDPHVLAVESMVGGDYPIHHRRFLLQYGEGSVLKRLTSAYPRGRSADWLKCKATWTADVVITGVVEGLGKYVGTTGALTFGQYRDGVLVERGKMAGMRDAERDAWWANPPIGQVAVLTYNGLCPGGEAFRHPIFAHLRTDKAPTDCTWDAA